jgi:MoxR-like ATPase
MPTKTKSAASKTPLELIQASYAKPNKTYDGKPPSLQKLESMPMIKSMAFSINEYNATGQQSNFKYIGPAGIAKTRVGLAMAYANELRPLYLNAGEMDQENLGMPAIERVDGKKSIVWALIRDYVTAGSKVLIIDELGQSDPGFLSAIMEVMSEGSIGGVSLQDLVSIWMFDNPSNSLNGDLQEADLAQADRMGTLFVTSADTPWEYGLALMFPEQDLKPVFNEYYRLPLSPQGYETLSPRVLEHIINALRLGFNGNLGRPIMNDRYIPITNTAGDDIGEEIVEKFAKALRLPNPQRSTFDFDRAVKLIRDEGLDIIAYGNQGTGKTSRAKELLAEQGVNVAYKSVPVISKEDINLSVLSEDRQFVEVVTHKEFMSEQDTVGIFDEITRGSRRTMNAVMPIIQEHMSGGEKLPGYKGTLMLTNYAKSGELEMDVEEVSLPFATRPDLNFLLNPDDLHALEWLVATFGESIVPFTDWQRMDLDAQPEYRDWISPRCLQRLYRYWKGGMVDLKAALPVVNGEYVPVPLVKLFERLGGADVVSFLDIVENTKDYLKRLTEYDKVTKQPLNPDLHLAAYTALLNAELPLLEAHDDVCLDVYKVLSEQWQISLMRLRDQKWTFWSNLILKGFPEIVDK